jgi:RNA polymerase sigma factor (sigma-70 family)
VQQSDFDQLYASRFTLSYVTALGVTRNPHDAQDVAQSVFCKIWANREAMDGEGPGRGWFIRAARNAAIDLVRHKARCEKVSVLFTDRIAEGTETQAIRNVEEARMSRALDRLAGDRRSLLQDSFYQRWSHARIAQDRNVALGTVKSQIRSSLNKMRVMLAG